MLAIKLLDNKNSQYFELQRGGRKSSSESQQFAGRNNGAQIRKTHAGKKTEEWAGINEKLFFHGFDSSRFVDEKP